MNNLAKIILIFRLWYLSIMLSIFLLNTRLIKKFSAPFFIFSVLLLCIFLANFIICLSPVYAAGLNQKRLAETIVYASKKYGIPLPFFIAVMKAESGFNVMALSPKGAVGLMQVMPKTGEEMDINVENPELNIIAGAKYLHYCLKRFGFKPITALACYNAGPDSVRTVYIKNRRKFIIPPYRQTEIYIMRVYRYYIYYRKILR
ncbi:MAG: lytic transglycosylase domain-containing protein [Deltaproteobacteria bacterium]|uniref:Lytic transglycosylase domain-containing protein n=1 Tax=Candidatus Acidulodesulfobacterium acidiphilum TaxID=2597224 RepID=A0A520XDW2_9DELT|nr:lytic transglycosylase domain-containing protein [Deltaproteobacteria bacterium]RZV39295.1 MAG: lytic transglycosylase domain-containing protein [Candidatus Acidulodesulfobacterium acidiphilum]